ncbi:MAG: ethanolamine utilization protein EutP [Clostridia bacterium]|nr:ethanolamine utilization protein EutP [Clostridia bacterium]
MKKMIFMGKSGSGKTTLIEAIRGQELVYRKTQYIDYSDALMDTPGEYAEGNDLGGALAVYSYEADVVALILAATDEFCIFPPACAPVANRPVVGVITKCDAPDARPDLAEMRLLLCGCEKIFHTSAKTGKGIDELRAYLQ